MTNCFYGWVFLHFQALSKELVTPKVVRGGLLVADNVVSHRAELDDDLRRLAADPSWFTVTVPIGKGEEVSLKLA